MKIGIKLFIVFVFFLGSCKAEKKVEFQVIRHNNQCQNIPTLSPLSIVSTDSVLHFCAGSYIQLQGSKNSDFHSVRFDIEFTEAGDLFFSRMESGNILLELTSGKMQIQTGILKSPFFIKTPIAQLKIETDAKLEIDIEEEQVEGKLYQTLSEKSKVEMNYTLTEKMEELIKQDQEFQSVFDKTKLFLSMTGIRKVIFTRKNRDFLFGKLLATSDKGVKDVNRYFAEESKILIHAKSAILTDKEIEELEEEFRNLNQIPENELNAKGIRKYIEKNLNFYNKKTACLQKRNIDKVILNNNESFYGIVEISNNRYTITDILTNQKISYKNSDIKIIDTQVDWKKANCKGRL